MAKNKSLANISSVHTDPKKKTHYKLTTTRNLIIILTPKTNGAQRRAPPPVEPSAGRLQNAPVENGTHSYPNLITHNEPNAKAHYGDAGFVVTIESSHRPTKKRSEQ